MAGQIISRGKSTWLVRVFLGRDPQTGKREYLNRTVNGNKKRAQDVLVDLLADKSKGNITPGTSKQTVGALLDDLLIDYRNNNQDYDWAKLLANTHLRPFFGEMPIAGLTSDHVNRYIETRRKAGRANATINHELSLLRRSLNLGKAATPPKVVRAPKIPKLDENNVRKGFFERSDFLKVRDALPEELRPVLTFAYYTGCRRGEIIGLRWDQVDLIERVIRLEPGETKNDEARIIPVTSEELYQTIAMQRSICDERFPECPWVFFRHGGQMGAFRKSWTTACKTAGLYDSDLKRPTKLFHDLRRTGVRNLVRAGVPEKVAQMISGHKTRAVFDRYNIVSEDDVKAAMKRLESYHKAVDEQAAAEQATRRAHRNPRVGTLLAHKRPTPHVQ